MVNYLIKKPEFFIKYMKELGNIIYEAYIEFGGKIRICGMDPSRICLLEFVYGGEELEIIEDEKRNFGLNFGELNKIFQRFKSPKEIFIKTNDNILIVTGDIGNKTKTFKINEYDIDTGDEIPMEKILSIPYNAIIRMEGSDLEDAIKDAELYNMELMIQTKGNNIIFGSNSIYGSTNTKIEMDYDIFSDEKSFYPIKFLKNMIKPMTNSKITLMLKTDYPLAIYDKLSNDSYIRWFLGPRVGEDQ